MTKKKNRNKQTNDNVIEEILNIIIYNNKILFVYIRTKFMIIIINIIFIVLFMMMMLTLKKNERYI